MKKLNEKELKKINGGAVKSTTSSVVVFSQSPGSRSDGLKDIFQKLFHHKHGRK